LSKSNRPITPHEPRPADVNRPETLEDREDLAQARRSKEERTSERPWYKSAGPGLITGAADDDPSGIGTYSQCGASFGYAQLWLIPFCLPLMIAVQEMCGRVGLVTGKGIAAVLKEHYPKWLLIGSVGLLFFANTLNIFADLNVMAASAKMMFGAPQLLWLTLITVILAALQVLVPYREYARVLKFSCLALVAYVIVAFLPGNHNDWGAIAKRLFVPSWSTHLDYLLASVGFLGTTISPYLFFWQAGETVEEGVAEGRADQPGKRKVKARDQDIRNVRADTVMGMVASQGVAFFILIATAGTLYKPGGTDINTAQDAAKALAPLGPAAYWCFSIGIIGTGFLAIPTLAGSAAYAAAETFGWRYGLYRRFNRAKGFYFTVIGVLFVSYCLNFFSKMSPVKALVYSAVVNAIVAVPLILVLLLICNNKKIVGKRTNGIWSNIFGWATFVFMGVAGAFFIWATLAGKS
jgi:NRAMP (natural resistance-associated macrophage protein)-like metal ion transporter